MLENYTQNLQHEADSAGSIESTALQQEGAEGAESPRPSTTHQHDHSNPGTSSPPPSLETNDPASIVKLLRTHLANGQELPYQPILWSKEHLLVLKCYFQIAYIPPRTLIQDPPMVKSIQESVEEIVRSGYDVFKRNRISDTLKLYQAKRDTYVLIAITASSITTHQKE